MNNKPNTGITPNIYILVKGELYNHTPPKLNRAQRRKLKFKHG